MQDNGPIDRSPTRSGHTFLVPRTGRQDAKDESPFLDFYNVPVVKFLIRFVAHAAFMTVYWVMICTRDYQYHDRGDGHGAVLVIDEVPEVKLIEYVWVFFEVGVFLDQRHMNLRSTLGRQDVFQKLWLLADCMLVVAVITRVISVIASGDSAQPMVRRGDMRAHAAPLVCTSGRRGQLCARAQRAAGIVRPCASFLLSHAPSVHLPPPPNPVAVHGLPDHRKH